MKPRRLPEHDRLTPVWAFLHEHRDELTPAAMLMALYLFDRARPDGVVWRSMNVLRDEFGLSRGVVIRGFKQLRAVRFLAEIDRDTYDATGRVEILARPRPLGGGRDAVRYVVLLDRHAGRAENETASAVSRVENETATTSQQSRFELESALAVSKTAHESSKMTTKGGGASLRSAPAAARSEISAGEVAAALDVITRVIAPQARESSAEFGTFDEFNAANFVAAVLAYFASERTEGMLKALLARKSKTRENFTAHVCKMIRDEAAKPLTAVERALIVAEREREAKRCEIRAAFDALTARLDAQIEHEASIDGYRRSDKLSAKANELRYFVSAARDLDDVENAEKRLAALTRDVDEHLAACEKAAATFIDARAAAAKRAADYDPEAELF